MIEFHYVENDRILLLSSRFVEAALSRMIKLGVEDLSETKETSGAKDLRQTHMKYI